MVILNYQRVVSLVVGYVVNPSQNAKIYTVNGYNPSRRNQSKTNVSSPSRDLQPHFPHENYQDITGISMEVS
jgi:hypothetical protein